MAGHSQFKNIMHRKGAQDAKRGKIFTKIAKEITVAARDNPDPDSNPRLRTALLNARQANMNKDNIDRAIKRATGEGAEQAFVEVRYEGYGPGGIAFIVEGLTNNKNRTAAEIRAAFNRSGGSLGEANSVAFSFSHVGYIHFSREVDKDKLFEEAINFDAEDFIVYDDFYEVICSAQKLHQLQDNLAQKFSSPIKIGLEWRAQNTVPVDKELAEKIIKLAQFLEDHDDVQSVSTNFEISDNVLQELTS